jgi:hypothetical protein
MKARLSVILLLIISLSILVITLKSEDIIYEQVKVEELDIDIQNVIKQINEQNIYFIIKDSIIILYSNLGKSGMYTYPSAIIKKKGDKLTVNIKSNMATDDEFVKEELFVRIYMNRLPKEINASFLGKQIMDYKIIDVKI